MSVVPSAVAAGRSYASRASRRVRPKAKGACREKNGRGG